MKFRKKPVVIEAIQWTGDNSSEVLRFMFPDIEPDATASVETIQTLEGKLHVTVGDWIIRGVKGELYPCKPDIFAATYEPSEIESDESGYDPIHTYFGLSYSNYLVMPRSVLQSMPRGWQVRFVAALNEIKAMFGHLLETSSYRVHLLGSDMETPIDDPLSDYQRGRRKLEPQGSER